MPIIKMEREPATGVSVLVVGAGIGGLTFAIEAYRKGHNVHVIERRPAGKSTGEGIMITSSALHTPSKWPGFMERAKLVSHDSTFELRKYDGTNLGFHTPGDPKIPTLAIYRRKLHTLLYEYARDLGIQIEFEKRAMEFFETDEHGGVVLADGSNLTADVVVAADGVASKSRDIIDGKWDPPISSGFIVYRTEYPTQLALSNPIIAKSLEGRQIRGFMYIGSGAHIVISINGEDLFWILTTKDRDPNAEESWTKVTSTDIALEAVKDWDPFVSEIIKMTPNNEVMDWKLMWRDPQSKWASLGGRIIQLGDSAHPFLPTSFSGGTMAMEDAYSLAACLQIAGKKDVPLATKVHNHLRFERVSCAQKMGFKNREMFHNTNWDRAPEKEEKKRNMVGKWVIFHDPEEYAYENYSRCAEHLLTGAPFENTNLVPGYKYKPWSVKELLSAAENKESDEDEGDWW